MKSLEELKAIREKVQSQMNLRDESGTDTRVVVGMATCGIAAGARPVLNKWLLPRSRPISICSCISEKIS